MAQLNQPDFSVWYGIAQRWISAALIHGDSLFTPGKNVWCLPAVNDIYHRFVDNADEGEDDFWIKLEKQIKTASPETVQLMAEVLYVYYLPMVGKLKIETKVGSVERVLDWIHPPVKLADDLKLAFNCGVARESRNYVQQRYYQLKFFIQFARDWWSLDASERQRLLDDPWAFKGFVSQIPVYNNNAARQMLLYLAHVGSFEPIMADSDKQAIAWALANQEEQQISDDDKRLLVIRKRLSVDRPTGFSFYDADLKKIWKPETVPVGDTGLKSLDEDDSDEGDELEPDINDVHYWKIAPGEQGRLWELCLKKSIICIGWNKLGDLRNIDRVNFDAALPKLMAENNYRKGCRTVWTFAKKIKQGDIIVANKGTSQVLGIGRVTGPYYFDGSAEFGHCLPVDWFDQTPKRVEQPGWLRTILKLEKETFLQIGGVARSLPERGKDSMTAKLSAFLVDHAFATLDELKAFALQQSIPIRQSTLQALYHYGTATLRQYIEKIGTSGNRSDVAVQIAALNVDSKPLPPPKDALISLLLDRMNVLLHGAPGTGKTYKALGVAELWKQWQGHGTVSQVTFHPSYAYEDFIEGFRPNKNGQFSLQSGVFVDIAEAARNDPQHKFLLIIDELNRGDVARIFGELITLIERDKRDSRASRKLPYSRNDFFVPSNLYLLGTMNTADRSISLLDIAIRRRFCFVEYGPSTSAITESDEYFRDVAGINLATLMLTLNHRLNHIGVERDRAIGHSYFLIARNTSDALGELRNRMRHDVIPLIEEYCYANRTQMSSVLGKLIREGLVADDVLDDDDEFIDALSKICEPGE